jgi:hypothetical protein
MKLLSAVEANSKFEIYKRTVQKCGLVPNYKDYYTQSDLYRVPLSFRNKDWVCLVKDYKLPSFTFRASHIPVQIDRMYHASGKAKCNVFIKHTDGKVYVLKVVIPTDYLKLHPENDRLRESVKKGIKGYFRNYYTRLRMNNPFFLAQHPDVVKTIKLDAKRDFYAVLYMNLELTGNVQLQKRKIRFLKFLFKNFAFFIRKFLSIEFRKPDNLTKSRKMIEYRKEHFVRDEVKQDYSHLYLFGENLSYTSGNTKISNKDLDLCNRSLKSLYSGKKHPKKTQAVIRGLNNAFPITTKKATKEQFEDTDYDYDLFKRAINTDIERIISDGRSIVVPMDGFATGRAVLPKRFAEYLVIQLATIGLKFIVVEHPTMDGYGVKPKTEW